MRPGASCGAHVAFRAKDDATQAKMAAQLRDKHGLESTTQKDRQYFRSVYFLEPGGILFEIATDDPGFTVDEPVTALGKSPETVQHGRVALTLEFRRVVQRVLAVV
jgi:glyoxalase family protein